MENQPQVDPQVVEQSADAMATAQVDAQAEGTIDAPSKNIPAEAGTSELMEKEAADLLLEAEAPVAEGGEQADIVSLATELFPDKSFASAEEAVNAIKDFYESAKKYEESVKESNQTLVNIFNDNPELLQLTRMIHKGASLTEALPHVINVDDLKPVEGDPDYDKWMAAKTQRENKIAEQNAAKDEVLKNIEMSMAQVEEFATEMQMSSEQAAEFLTEVDNLMENISKGNISKETLTKLHKALAYEKDIQDAKEQAEIKGRNEAIEEKVAKEEAPKGDKLPDISGAGSGPEAPAEEINPTANLSKNIEDYSSQRRF